MMTNLFSSFDPATSINLSLNWLSILIPISIIHLSIWTLSSQHQTVSKFISTKIHKEMSAMKMSKPKGVTIISLSIMWWIMISNLSGLLPYSFTATSHIITSLPLALTLWLSLTLFGWFKNTSHMLSHMLPLGTPPQLMMFMVCIETISSVIRPLTLAVRLSANMIAGHLLISLMSNTMINLKMSLLISVLPIELTLMLLETAVAFIQSYVFMTLIMLYMSETN